MCLIKVIFHYFITTTFISRSFQSNAFLVLLLLHSQRAFGVYFLFIFISLFGNSSSAHNHHHHHRHHHHQDTIISNRRNCFEHHVLRWTGNLHESQPAYQDTRRHTHTNCQPTDQDMTRKEGREGREDEDTEAPPQYIGRTTTCQSAPSSVNVSRLAFT